MGHYITAAENHLTYIALAVILLLALNALRHLGGAVVHHVLLGWLAGILSAVAIVSKLSKPAALLADGKTADLPKGFPVTVNTTEGARTSSVHATVTSVPVVPPVLTLVLLVLLIVLALFATRHAKKKAQLRRPPAAKTEGPEGEEEPRERR